MAVGLILLAAFAIWLWASVRNSHNGQAVIGSGFPTSLQSQVQSMAQAIFQYEGGGKPGATNSWNDNPGNIGGGQNTFPTMTAGWNALTGQIQTDATNHPSWTFYNFFAHYLTGDPTQMQVTDQGNPTAYANYVAGQLGVSPNETVSTYLGGG